MPSKSSTATASLKPFPGFPLTAHRGANQWCKKHRGKTFYFGPLADWQAAKAQYEYAWPFIIQGLTPPVRNANGTGYTLRELCNYFLEAKRHRLEAGELTSLSYRDYYQSCKRMIEHFGADRRVDDLRPVDFEAFRAKLAAKYSPGTLLGEVNRCRIALKFAWDQRLVSQPVHFGQSFDRPPKRVRRKARNETGVLKFTRDELLAILSALDGKPSPVVGKSKPITLTANPQLKAMTLLGLNGGLGATDCANLKESHIDFAGGWLNYPRIKTETPRRIPLWTETLESLKEVLSVRKSPRDPADAAVVFLTRTRQRWVRTKNGETPEKNVQVNAISQQFGKLLHALNINGRRGLNFYTLRRQFEIVAGESRDQVAVDAVMGHVDESMAAVYRQGVISDERLREVVDHVHLWLFGEAEQK